MQKLKQVLNWLLDNGIFFPLVILVLVYVRWFQLSPPVYGQWFEGTATYVMGYSLLLAYIFCAFLLRLARNSIIPRVLLFLLTAGILGINALYVYAFMPVLESTVDCKGATYYLTYNQVDSGEQLTTWRGLFNYDSGYYGYDAIDSRHDVPIWGYFVCNEQHGEVDIFNYGNYPIYHIGAQAYFYTLVSSLSTGNHSFDLLSYAPYKSTHYVIYECRNTKVDACQINAVDLSSLTPQDQPASLIIDAKTRDVYILLGGSIRYAFTDKTRQFVDLASQETTFQLDQKLGQLYVDRYSLAAYPQKAGYTYILYMCEITSTFVSDSGGLCYDLPFSYSTPGLESASLVINKPEDQLSVLIGGKPVYIYKGVYDPKCSEGCADAVCLVDGCMVPKP